MMWANTPRDDTITTTTKSTFLTRDMIVRTFEVSLSATAGGESSTNHCCCCCCTRSYLRVTDGSRVEDGIEVYIREVVEVLQDFDSSMYRVQRSRRKKTTRFRFRFRMSRGYFPNILSILLGPMIDHKARRRCTELSTPVIKKDISFDAIDPLHVTNLDVLRRDWVAGTVGVGEGVQESLQGPLEQVHEGLLDGVLAAAAEHRVLQDVGNARRVFRGRSERYAEYLP